jgi:hypothetical protein
MSIRAIISGLSVISVLAAGCGLEEPEADEDPPQDEGTETAALNNLHDDFSEFAITFGAFRDNRTWKDASGRTEKLRCPPARFVLYQCPAGVCFGDTGIGTRRLNASGRPSGDRCTWKRSVRDEDQILIDHNYEAFVELRCPHSSLRVQETAFFPFHTSGQKPFPGNEFRITAFPRETSPGFWAKFAADCGLHQ